MWVECPPFHDHTPLCRPDAVVDPWIGQLWEELMRLYPLPQGLIQLSDTVLYPIPILHSDTVPFQKNMRRHSWQSLEIVLSQQSFPSLNCEMYRLPSKYEVTMESPVTEGANFVPVSSVSEATPISVTATPTHQHPFMARLVSNVRVTPQDHFQDVRLVTFDVQNSGIQ